MAGTLTSSRGGNKRERGNESHGLSEVVSKAEGKKKKQYLTRKSRKMQKIVPGTVRSKDDAKDMNAVQWKSASEQAEWLTSQFYSVSGSRVAPLERQPIPDSSVVYLSHEKDHSVDNLSWHVKRAMGPSWKDTLCGDTDSGQPSEREIGSPSLVVLGSSAIRCVELLRGLAQFTRKCKAVKLFAKHIKIDEQVTSLKNRVDIAAGTPNRVRKLVDIGALGIGHLAIVILDMHRDAKGLTLLSVPEVMVEFWELYKTHLHELVLGSQCRLILY